MLWFNAILRFGENWIASNQAMGLTMAQMLAKMLLLFPATDVTSSLSTLKDNTLTSGYVVGIQATEGSINACAGVLIGPKYVLSANCKPNWTFVSHGIVNLDASGTNPVKRYALIGSDYNSGKHLGKDMKSEEIIAIFNWVRHPDYNAKTGEFNYFIFTLDTKSRNTPVTLPDSGSSISSGSTAIVTGFPTIGRNKLVEEERDDP